MLHNLSIFTKLFLLLYNICYRFTDSLWAIDGALFCTLDRDNDGSKAKVCTTDYHGGWWYTWDAWCTEANLNGFYYPTYKPEMTGIFWFYLDGYFTLKEARMMIRKQ